MKTEIITVNKTKVQYIAVLPGQKVKDVRSSEIPAEEHEKTIVFRNDEEDGAYCAELSAKYFGGIEISAVIEYQPEGIF
jgi:hypothetical protein